MIQRDSSFSKAFTDASPIDAHELLTSHTVRGDIRHAYEEFMRLYGHRTVSEVST